LYSVANCHPTGASHFRRKWKAEWRDLLFPLKHRNPALARPWSSFRHYLTGDTSAVEIESQWTARRREQLGIFPTVRTRSAEETPRPSEKLGRATRRTRSFRVENPHHEHLACKMLGVLLVIFGAGASYDSVPHLPASQVPGAQYRLPLANQLFDGRTIFVEAMKQFPECMEIIPFLRKPGISVESELARFQLQAETFPRAYQELAAIRYYLQLALWNCQDVWRQQHFGITNYATLLREIERWRYGSSGSVCFVTFNYDTMLEEAMNQVLGFQVVDLNTYVAQSNYVLVKLHGSINWGRELDVTLVGQSYTPQYLIREAASLKVSDRYRLVGPSVASIGQNKVVFPALSIPVENKDVFECPRTHLDKLEQFLPRVDRIMTIGWRATEAEFLNLLHKWIPQKQHLLIVSGDHGGAKETLANLTKGGPPDNPSVRLSEIGFTGLLLSELEKLEAFLHQQGGVIQ
jgi:hypothetical protein